MTTRKRPGRDRSAGPLHHFALDMSQCRHVLMPPFSTNSLAQQFCEKHAALPTPPFPHKCRIIAAETKKTTHKGLIF
ncbi:MAG TPA: hypothetical protein PKD78_09685, partial [Saprospiraceae bacterium]|nr:hypothetical protein [Saprospiraceae bacterium]